MLFSVFKFEVKWCQAFEYIIYYFFKKSRTIFLNLRREVSFGSDIVLVYNKSQFWQFLNDSTTKLVNQKNVADKFQ